MFSRHSPLRLPLAILALAVLTPTASGQGQVQFRAGADVFHIQVAVESGDGAFVRDLGPDDFELLVDGEPRELVTAYTVDSDDPDPSWLIGSESNDVPAAEGVVTSTNDLPAAARRRFLVLLDLSRMSFQGLQNTRRALRDFLDENLREADLLGMVIYYPRRGLEYVVPFTTRHERVASEVDRLVVGRVDERIDDASEGIPIEDIASFYATAGPGGAGGGGDTLSASGDVSGLTDSALLVSGAIEEVEQLRIESAAALLFDALQRLAGTLAATEGRKHVLMFSHGFSDETLQQGSITRALDEFAAEARRGDVVFFTFDPANVGGSSASNPHDISEIGSSWQPGTSSGLMVNRSMLYAVADETGGEASFWRGGVKDGLESVERDSNEYYVLAFPVRSDDPDTVRISVRARAPGVRVTWAPRELRLLGDPAPPNSFQRQFQVAEALEAGVDRSDLPVQVRAWLLPGDAGLRPVAIVGQVEADTVAELRAANAGGRIDLELLGLTVNANSTVTDYFRGVARSEAPVEGDAPAQPFRFGSWVRVAPGRHFLKVLVRETRSGRLFSQSLAVTVPEYEETGLAIDEPILVVPPDQARMLRGIPLSATGRIAPEDSQDAESPWDRTLGRPVTVRDPFVINGMPVTIDLADTAFLGDDVDFMTTVGGITAHASGEPRVALAASLVDAEGRIVALRPLDLTRSEWRPETGNLQVLLRARVPAHLLAGRYDLRVEATDTVAGTSATSAMSVWVR